MSASLAAWTAIYAGILISVACGMRRNLTASTADRGAKTRHILFVLFLVYMHFEPSMWLIGAILTTFTRGYQHVPKAYYIDSMIISGGAGVVVWLLVVLASTAVMFLASGMARSRRWAGRFFVVLLPFIFVLDSLMMYVGMACRPGKHPADTIQAVLFSQLFFLTIAGWVYVWMYRFYHSERSRLIFSQREQGALQDGGTGDSDSGATVDSE